MGSDPTSIGFGSNRNPTSSSVTHSHIGFSQSLTRASLSHTLTRFQNPASSPFRGKKEISRGRRRKGNRRRRQQREEQEGRRRERNREEGKPSSKAGHQLHHGVKKREGKERRRIGERAENRGTARRPPLPASTPAMRAKEEEKENGGLKCKNAKSDSKPAVQATLAQTKNTERKREERRTEGTNRRRPLPSDTAKKGGEREKRKPEGQSAKTAAQTRCPAQPRPSWPNGGHQQLSSTTTVLTNTATVLNSRPVVGDAEKTNPDHPKAQQRKKEMERKLLTGLSSTRH